MVLMVDCSHRSGQHAVLTKTAAPTQVREIKPVWRLGLGGGEKAHPANACESVQCDGEPDGVGTEGETAEHHLTQTTGLAPAGEEGDREGAEEVCECGGRGQHSFSSPGGINDTKGGMSLLKKMMTRQASVAFR